MDITSYVIGKKAGGGSPTPINLQDKDITITQNGETIVSADTGYDGLSSVDITTNVPAPSKDVVFYDYDGTELYSYTKDEFLALTEMPANPTHTGLTAQGWNWSLTDAKNYVGTQGLGVLDIGQNYITDNGETRYYLTIPNANKSLTLNLKVNGTVIINWGDGSETEEASGTSTGTAITKQHTYNNVGDYVIRIMPKTQETKINVLTNRCLDENQACFMISKMEIGSNCVTISGSSSSAVNCVSNLETITIPTNIKYFDSNSFNNMYNLKALIVPEGVETCDSISGVYSMKILSLSSSVNSLTITGLNQDRICMYIPTNNVSFQECRGLKKVYLYAVSGSIAYNFRTTGIEKLVIFGGTSLNVQQNDKLKELDFRETNISTITLSSNLWPANRGLEIVRYNESADFYGFSTQSTNLKLVDFRTRTTIPSITGTAVTNFTTYQPRCKFVVPDNLYATWITTSGWSQLANRIIKASDYTEE